MLKEHRWIAKALVQKAISKTGMIGAYHFAQQAAGKLKHFSPRIGVDYAGLIGADIGMERIQGSTVVEIGTGWVPVIPIGLHLLGVKRILSFDLTKHLLPDLTMKVLRAVGSCLPDLAQGSGVPLPVLQDRFESLVSARGMYVLAKRSGFEYRAPCDVTTSNIEPHSVDLLYSNLVFEHVTPKALAEILAFSRRVLKPGGRAWHHIDYSDHYAHSNDLSLINFLRYGERTWDAFGQSALHYQNRLRRSDYVRAFESAGFEVVRAIDHIGVSEAQAREVPLAKRFASRHVSDLMCTGSRFVLSP